MPKIPFIEYVAIGVVDDDDADVVDADKDVDDAAIEDVEDDDACTITDVWFDDDELLTPPAPISPTLLLLPLPLTKSSVLIEFGLIIDGLDTFDDDIEPDCGEFAKLTRFKFPFVVVVAVVDDEHDEWLELPFWCWWLFWWLWWWFLAFSAALFRTIRLILDTDGILSASQIPSANKRSRISHANIVGLDFL